MKINALKTGESLVICTPAGRVVVTFVRRRGVGVAIGFDAPDGVAVDRSEVHLRKTSRRNPPEAAAVTASHTEVTREPI